MWNCSLPQQILSHRLHDWKLCEWFLLSGFLICHAVGWYTELKVLMEDTWEKDFDLRLSKRVFQNPHVIYATTRVNSFTIFLLSLFYCRQYLCQVNRQFFHQTSWWSRYVPFFVYGVLWSLGIQYKLGKSSGLFTNAGLWRTIGFWCLTPLLTIFSYIVAVSFIGGGNRSTCSNPVLLVPGFEQVV